MNTIHHEVIALIEAGPQRKVPLKLPGLYEDPRDFARRCVQRAVELEREECAKVAEGGSFLHADSPAAKFGKDCAAAIRRRASA